MILLKSYGDRLVSGKYELHSRSKHAANFIFNGAMACCVDEYVGPGPFSVVITGAPIDSIHSLAVEKKRVTINGNLLNFDRAGRYCSRIESPPQVSRDKLKENLKYFSDHLKQLSCPLSLLFLINPAKESEFATDFGIEYIRRFRNGLELFFGENSLEGVQRLRGLGFGLTPSGDDFLAGAMAAIQMSQSVLKTNNSERLNLIYQQTRGDNPLVNAFLENAKEGAYIKRFRDIIIAVYRGNLLDIKQHTQRLLEAGKTSGVDWAVGFYITSITELNRAKDQNGNPGNSQ
jgi:hypothetical protein